TSLAECRARWLANTRAYAKRQLTWFRARPEAVFLPCEGADAELLSGARRFLAGQNGA
ncbi:MAG: tRNA (adenosine(37)-N6)-dimethylallyltransferase MiaA, partial [Desulfovibrio sp.]|nr:tRNA (adenosine(37)-N6)-dimethylallyltransferase MiaA [Desulfovibrio sp.]